MIELLRVGPPAGEAAIRDFERERGVEIPVAYLGFLLDHDGALPEANALEGWDDEIGVDEFLGLGGLVSESVADVWDGYGYGARLPAGWFPFASAAGGNVLLLSMTGPLYGRVGYWNHEHEGSSDALTVVAASFADFLQRLRPDRS